MAGPQPIPLGTLAEARPGRARRTRGRRDLPNPAWLARRSRAVFLLKRGLPLAALAALMLVALWPQIAGMDESVRVAYRKPTLAVPSGAASVVEPRFQGTDELGRPFTVSADSALQPAGDPAITLTRPRGDLTLEDGAWILLQAKGGVFDREERRLDLSGEVTLFHDSGYQVRTDQASVDLRAGTATGRAPVAAQGPAGTLDAVGFAITDRGDVLTFGGPARMLLVPGAGERR